MVMSRPEAEKKIEDYSREYARLRRELSQTGFLWVGTVLHRYHVCGHPSCRCRRGGRFRHGPYYYWTRKILGKTVTRMLSEKEGRLYCEWIRNRRRLNQTIQKMLALSQRVAPLLIRRPNDH